ncbi:MAG: DMT family transporter [Veillonella sp.]|nr:DMT family transporter [Veillonella sp.]
MQKAFFYAIASSFAFSVMNLFVKMLGQGMPASEITFFRGLIGTVAVVGFMAAKRIPFSTEHRGMLVMRGIFGGLGTLLNFVALAYMSMADASILFQLSGIFVFVFSSLVLREALPKGALKWLLVILVAVAVIVKPWSFGSLNWYSLYAVAGAAFAAAAYTTIRKISQSGHHSPYEIMFYFLFTTALVGGVLMWPNFVIPDARQWIYIAIIGGISVFAQFFLTGAFIATNAVVAQFLQYIGVFFNTFWGFAIFNETLSWATVGAGIIMFLASVMLARLKEQHHVASK